MARHKKIERRREIERRRRRRRKRMKMRARMMREQELSVVATDEKPLESEN
ncbi:MAG: hypothetical protein JRI45_07425 [Deltaproteobacteria bacterium]|nr:hypothetical protein [Deltaproteobacteria bacterium]MBW2068721.1 hypothetical protein [Deltaproteobacteria bacterium]